MHLDKINETVWELPRVGAMRVPGRIYADEMLIQKLRNDDTLKQVAHVACLPGIVNYSLAMPDAHAGYGFPIGGVAAIDPDDGGVISPGGVGYDINCGVRLITTFLDYVDLKDRIRDLTTILYRDIPCGVGSSNAIAKLSKTDLKRILEKGAAWAVEHGFGAAPDLDVMEEGGCMSGADMSMVSEKAQHRGIDQMGTLGSGNHFAEIGVVDRICDEKTAAVFGLREGQVTLMLHSGSRGLGYQVCDDYIKTMGHAARKYEISIPDRQLCCAPIHSREGREYFAAMAGAANYAWANRQVMMSLAIRAIEHALNISPRELGARLLYDICHNIAKFERHQVNGKTKQLCVHRKGATRAFPGNRPETPPAYREVGQPVLIPGDMGTASYVFAGTQTALDTTFGSCCHGAGRLMSRSEAKRHGSVRALMEELEAQGISIMAKGRNTLLEESPAAYKDIEQVTCIVEASGLGKRVARIRPAGVIKG